MNEFYQRALELMGRSQRAYQRAFGIAGSPEHLAIVDLAHYCCAFEPDPMDLNDAGLREMHGRRQAFFRLWMNLKLSQQEMETVCKGTLMRRAQLERANATLRVVNTGE